MISGAYNEQVQVTFQPQIKRNMHKKAFFEDHYILLLFVMI